MPPCCPSKGLLSDRLSTRQKRLQLVGALQQGFLGQGIRRQGDPDTIPGNHDFALEASGFGASRAAARQSDQRARRFLGL